MSDEKRLCVAIYTPMIGGLYYSELTTQIIQLCEIKRYTVKVIRTGGYGEYTSKFGLQNVDVVILLRNAVDVGWVRDVRASGKVVVSISYDYFPLDVPAVFSDHEYGIKLAMDALRQLDCTEYAFVGNLSNYDIRKRYESFCEYCDDEKLEFSESNLLCIDEDLLGGGYKAAVEFEKRNCKAKGIIFGTTMNALGFCKYLKNQNPVLLETLFIISFDAHSMVPVLEANISTIDQNYNLLVHKAISTGEAMLKGSEVEKRSSVKPKLISRHVEEFNGADAYMATSCEINELYDANYMKCITYNMHEWVDIIAKSNFDDIMILRPLFEGNLELVTFGRFVNVGSGKKYFKVLKAILPKEVIHYTPQDKESLYKEEVYPQNDTKLIFDDFDKELHLVIDRDGGQWGVLSVYGYSGKGAGKSSYVSLVMYLEWILTHTSPRASAKVSSTSNSKDNINDQSPKEMREGKIVWHVNSNTFKWDYLALSILGFETDLDKGIYATMELSDRILETEVMQLREQVEMSLTSVFTLNVHYRHKNREYIPCEISSMPSTKDGLIEFRLRGS